jgi:putative SOS response-associated peptidase YedK
MGPLRIGRGSCSQLDDLSGERQVWLIREALFSETLRRASGRVRPFAGLWERWKDPIGEWVKTCSILTTTPNAVTAPVHDRMPVILDPDSYDLWLDPGMKDMSAASEMLKPYDARAMRCYPVSTRINSVINDDEECSRPVETC